MNKQELIDNVSEKAGLTMKDVQSVIELTVESVKKGDKVTIVGFGTFSQSQRAARQGRNQRIMAYGMCDYCNFLCCMRPLRRLITREQLK